MPPKRKAAPKKGKKAAKVAEVEQEADVDVASIPVEEVSMDITEQQAAATSTSDHVAPEPVVEPPAAPSIPSEEPLNEDNPEMEMDPTDERPAGDEPGPSMTMDERRAKMQALREKMHSTRQANRKDLIDENTKAKTNARDLVRQERQRKLAETLRERVDAEDRGEDVDRKKNWEYTIEENEEWEKRQASKKRKSNFEFNDYEDAARKRYLKDIDMLKPDLKVYEEQKAAASGSSSSAIVAHQNLYRDANSLIYADHKPSEEAIDRVASKLNADIDRRRNFSKTRVNEKEGDITYINEANRVFNKKIERYYNKYTTEIRANFERGTAL